MSRERKEAVVDWRRLGGAKGWAKGGGCVEGGGCQGERLVWVRQRDLRGMIFWRHWVCEGSGWVRIVGMVLGCR